MQFDREPLLERQLLAGRVPPASYDDLNDLVDLAQARALPGPVLTPPERRFAQEIREELADVANYAPWGFTAGQLTATQVQQLGYHLAAAFGILRGTA